MNAQRPHWGLPQRGSPFCTDTLCWCYRENEHRKAIRSRATVTAPFNATVDSLIGLYGTWCADNNLGVSSADVMLEFNKNLTPKQRAWLEAYSALWEASV